MNTQLKSFLTFFGRGIKISSISLYVGNNKIYNNTATTKMVHSVTQANGVEDSNSQIDFGRQDAQPDRR